MLLSILKNGPNKKTIIANQKGTVCSLLNLNQMAHTWSNFQLDIFKAIKNENKHILINATAGASKSTVLVEGAKLVPPYKKAKFIAFNKSIVESIKTKLPNHIDCSTIHSFGMKMLFRHFRKTRVFEMKTFSFADKMISSWKIKEEDRGYYCYQLFKLYNLFRMNLGENEEDIVEIAERHGIPFIDQKDVKNAMELFEKINDFNHVVDFQETKAIDFTDMIYLPATDERIKIDQFDIIYVDEFQDFNKTQNALLQRMIKPGGRIVAVGDPRQTIFGFAGADQNVFNDFGKQANVLPLSISYRCSKAVVRKAQEIYNFIQPWENAEEGEVRDGRISELKDGDFVLCRINRPLISLYFQLLGKKKKCYIKGKDIGDDLINLCKKVQRYSKQNGIDKLYDELDLVEEKLTKRGIKNSKSHNAYISLLEKIEAVEMVASHCKDLTEVINMLEKIFQEDGEGIQLMSIHKSKGLEAENVFILCPELIMSKKRDQQPWEVIAEQNIAFVAFSRAKLRLIFITDFIDVKSKV